MKRLREVMNAQDWSAWSATPACVQKLAAPNDVCDNVDGAEVRREVDMGSIGEDHVALKRRVSELERELTGTALARDEVVRAFQDMKRRAESAEQDASADAHEVESLRASVAWYDNAANEERKRAEQAERERDEFKAKAVKHGQAYVAERARADNATANATAFEAAWEQEKVARERAEAENAALLAAFRDAFAAMTHMGDTLNSMDAVDEDEDSEAMAQCERATAFAAVLVKQQACGEVHPGAALLEELRALRKVRDVVLELGPMDVGNIRLFDGERLERLRAAVGESLGMTCDE